jgi:hypothetical protein
VKRYVRPPHKLEQLEVLYRASGSTANLSYSPPRYIEGYVRVVTGRERYELGKTSATTVVEITTDEPPPYPVTPANWVRRGTDSNAGAFDVTAAVPYTARKVLVLQAERSA